MKKVEFITSAIHPPLSWFSPSSVLPASSTHSFSYSSKDVIIVNIISSDSLRQIRKLLKRSNLSRNAWNACSIIEIKIDKWNTTWSIFVHRTVYDWVQSMRISTCWKDMLILYRVHHIFHIFLTSIWIATTELFIRFNPILVSISWILAAFILSLKISMKWPLWPIVQSFPGKLLLHFWGKVIDKEHHVKLQ